MEIRIWILFAICLLMLVIFAIMGTKEFQISIIILIIYFWDTTIEKFSLRCGSHTINQWAHSFRKIDGSLLATAGTDHSLDIPGSKPAAIIRIPGAVPYIGKARPGQIPDKAMLLPIRAA